jgi:hypothetical protein
MAANDQEGDQKGSAYCGYPKGPIEMHVSKAERGNTTLRCFQLAHEERSGCSNHQEVDQEADGANKQSGLSPSRETTSCFIRRTSRSKDEVKLPNGHRCPDETGPLSAGSKTSRFPSRPTWKTTPDPGDYAPVNVYVLIGEPTQQRVRLL